MCLRIKSLDVNRIKWKKNNTATVYKALKLVNEYKYFPKNKRKDFIEGSVLSSPIFYFKFVPGENSANGAYDINYSYYLLGEIGRGAIHVFTNKKIAKREFPNKIIVELTVKRKDFIAYGEKSQACFKKVFLSKKNYQKALKSKC